MHAHIQIQISTTVEFTQNCVHYLGFEVEARTEGRKDGRTEGRNDGRRNKGIPDQACVGTSSFWNKWK